MKYNIREMSIDDIMDVINGEEKIFGETLGYDMLYSELKLNPYANYLVLEIDKLVKGYIGVWINEDNAEIVNFYVDKEYQNMGFGTMMLDFVLKLCEMSKVPVISLEVREHNERAIKLYEKFGFIYSHTRERYYKDLENALILIKRFEVK